MPKTKQKKQQKDDQNLLILSAVAVIVVASFSFLYYRNTAIKNAEMMQQAIKAMPVVVTLDEQNISHESGTATLKEENGKVKVTLDIKNSPTYSQPVHIHLGSCPNPGAVVFPLTPPVNGKSETVIDTTIDKLKALGKLAINLHKSDFYSKIYVACGNVNL